MPANRTATERLLSDLTNAGHDDEVRSMAIRVLNGRLMDERAETLGRLLARLGVIERTAKATKAKAK